MNTMVTDYEALKIWIDIAQFVITGAIGVYLWWERHRETRDLQIRALEKSIENDLDEISDRVTKVETLIESMPSHDDMGEIHEKINDSNEKIGQIVGEMSGIKTTLNLIHQHLLNGSKS